ncbi:MAG: hypothetical protein IPK31_07425 [Chitinophagaceae bacterium]|nr:hypothetical protein [Chitinophagaceae bacterium]
MKKIIPAFALFLLLSCEDNSQKTDKEKVESETKIEIKTDSAEVKIGENGVSIKGKDDNNDSVDIKINADDGIKIEGKDGKVEIKTKDGGNLKIEKKEKGVNIQIKEN